MIKVNPTVVREYVYCDSCHKEMLASDAHVVGGKPYCREHAKDTIMMLGMLAGDRLRPRW